MIPFSYRLIYRLARFNHAMPVCLLAVVFSAICTLAQASEASNLNVVILFRDDMAVHKRLVQDVQGLLEGRKAITVQTVPVKSRDTSINPFDFVLAIGDSALAEAMKFQDSKGIFLLVTDVFLASQAVSTGRWQGAMIQPPYEFHMRALRSMLPHVIHLGLLHSPESEQALHLLLQAASRTGVVIKAKRVEPAGSLQALRFLFDECHAVFMFPDTRLLNNLTMESMLLLQQEKRRAVIGISKTSVAAGALMAVAYDLERLPEVTYRAIKGYQESGQMPDETAFADAVVVYYNSEVAQRLGLQLNSGKLPFMAVELK
jgi:hypothetical protein